MLVLLMLAALLSAQVVQRDFACRICDRLVPALRVSQYRIGSCHDRLPLELCNAIEKTLAIKMHTRYQEALCQPSFCVRYTAECTCAISKTLMQVAETNKEQPEVRMFLCFLLISSSVSVQSIYYSSGMRFMGGIRQWGIGHKRLCKYRGNKTLENTITVLLTKL